MTKINIVRGMALLMLFIVEISAIPISLRALFYSVAIPVFLFSCGYEAEESAGNILKKDSVSVLFPYVLTCIFSGVCGASGLSATEPAAVIKQITPVWIVLALYVLAGGYALLRRLEKKISVIGVGIVVMIISAAGMFMGMKGFHLPLGADALAAMSIFVLVGDLFRRCEFWVEKSKYILFPVVLAVWSVLVYFGRWMELPIRAYRGHVMCVVCACAGCVALVGVAALLGRCKAMAAFLDWCGRNRIIGLCLIGFVQLNLNWMKLYPFIPATWMEDALFRIVVLLFVMLCIRLLADKIADMNRE